MPTRSVQHVLVVMPVFHSRARSILGSKVETGFINCYESSNHYRIIRDVLCFRAAVPRSQQDEEQLRHTDACLFVLRISTQRFVSPTALFPLGCLELTFTLLRLCYRSYLLLCRSEGK